MEIRIPIHPAFLENNDETPASDGYEKATEKTKRFIVKREKVA